MSYDIAIGRCTTVGEGYAVVRIEGAMLARLDETYRFQGPGKSLLKVPVAICSKTRQPAAGAELYLDHDALKAGASADLDRQGNGTFQTVSLAPLLEGPPPGERPSPAPRAMSMYYRVR